MHEDFFNSVVNGNVPDILLIPLDTNNFEHYKNLLAFVFDTSHSVTIDYMDSGSVLYTVLPGSQPMLSYFQCFSASLWTLILMLGIMVSILLTSTSKSWSNVFDNTWSVLGIQFNLFVFYIVRENECVLVIFNNDGLECTLLCWYWLRKSNRHW